MWGSSMRRVRAALSVPTPFGRPYCDDRLTPTRGHGLERLCAPPGAILRARSLRLSARTRTGRSRSTISSPVFASCASARLWPGLPEKPSPRPSSPGRFRRLTRLA